MKSILPNHPILRRPLVFLVIWGGIVLLFTIQLQLITEQPLRDSFIRSASRWSPWVILTPLVFWITARFPWSQREHLLKHGIIHAVASVGIALLAQTIYEVAARPIQQRVLSESPRRQSSESLPGVEAGPRPGPPRAPSAEVTPRLGSNRPERRPPPPPQGSRRVADRPDSSLGSVVVHHLSRTLPTYWALMGLQSVLLFGAQLRQRERQALELQTKLTQSHLDTLKLQLQPHFLFNALNAISTLVYREPKTADKMIGNLSTLLRGVLDEQNSNELPLSRELELLGAYLGIEQMRFGDRVQFEQDVAAECLQASVPTFFLQPIVENAVRHGLEPSGKSGTIWLVVKRLDSQLLIRVEDNGVGRQSMSAKGWGIGLSNAEARLEALYGKENFELELSDREGGGTMVRISLPFKSSHS